MIYSGPIVLGSAVHHLSLNTYCPVLIIKDNVSRDARKGGKFRWAVCTDGSDKSLKAFHVLAKMIDKSKDEVVAIIVETGNVNIPYVEKIVS
jgi:hypothetical protein